MNPEQLRALVAGIRKIEAALGDGVKTPQAAEADTRMVARRSLFVDRAVLAGKALEAADLVALRPAGGIGPERLDLVVGRRAVRPLDAGTMLSWSDLG
jgi:N-acetylneuraminate synthase/N,N'-diacetyllegionaminate synthase